MADRIAFEDWFATLTGDYRNGADDWAAHRSMKGATCKGGGSRLAGCQAAQQRLAASDTRRKADPEYRQGWNAAPPRAAPAAFPSRPDHPAASPWALWFGAAAGLVALFVLGRATIAYCHRRAGRAAAMAEVAAQASRLHIRKIQLSQPDFYGAIDAAPWEKEKQAFVKKRIMPILERGGFTDVAARILPQILRAIDDAADRELPSRSALTVSNPKIFHKAMDPIDYELHCALQLQQAGWKTTATPRNGDQGADVIAQRAGVSLVAQCKLYSSAVGNGAVQEVASARQYYKADLAIVVSNAPFTRSARQLAGVLNIRLMYHDELRSFIG